tara:strand:- start:11116 stop:11334 length:219 start_codon:yes stop_codon:yes gene_type:complete
MWLAIIIFYFILLFLVCRFFSVSKEIKQRPKKRELSAHQKQLLNIMTGRDKNQDLTESELESLKEDGDKCQR